MKWRPPEQGCHRILLKVNADIEIPSVRVFAQCSEKEVPEVTSLHLFTVGFSNQ